MAERETKQYEFCVITLYHLKRMGVVEGVLERHSFFSFLRTRPNFNKSGKLKGFKSSYDSLMR